MCRLAIIINKNNINIEYLTKLLWFYEHSIFKQCYKEPYTPYDDNNPRNHKINLDGFGIGFFADNIPKKYTNIIPSWNDTNLFQIIPYIKTKVLLTHIRAVDSLSESNFKYLGNKSNTPVHLYNCHPFIYKNWMFCHNGFIECFYKGSCRKKIINKIKNHLLLEILGTTDSEYIFYLIISYYEIYNDMIKSIINCIKFLNKFSGIITVNLIITDGINTYATRYVNSNNDKPPSLYYIKKNDEIILSSEPLEKNNTEWILVKKNSIISIKDFEINFFNIDNKLN